METRVLIQSAPKTLCSLSPTPMMLHSLPASIKKDRIKSNREKVATPFSPLWVNGGFLLPWIPEFWSFCLKTLCSLSPSQVMLQIKFDQDWPTGLRDIKVRKCNIFVIQGQVTPKWVVWSRPKSNSPELLCLSWLPATLMMIRWKNEQASMETPFFHYRSMEIFRHSRAANSVVSGLMWPKFELVCDFMHVLVTCKYIKDRIKINREKVETSFSPL